MHARPQPKDWEGTEQVFGTSQESEALVVQGLLDANGIESVLAGLAAPQQALPGVGGIVLRVPAEKAAEARLIIADYRQNAAAESGTSEETAD